MRPHNDAPSWRALPGKEQSVFKHMMWLYEQKHNKKAIKQADIILKKFPEHGETLSMKGLILSNMGSDKKQEAYEYAKRGLRADITNCVCWHVLGLLYRQDKDYAEASKCFVQTLRLDPNNYQAMKDLANLQIHERNLQGFLETRRHILKARSRFIREWAAFAMANHLVGRLTVAQDILGEMEKQFGESRDLDAFEKSEIMLYKATLLEEMGEYKKCYDYISERESSILDETAMLEMQGRMAIFLQQHELGRASYKRLIESNKDNECYILGLMACDEDERIRSLFALPCCSLNGAIGRADSMDFVKNLKQLKDGKIFRSSADAYIYLMPRSLRSSGEDSGGWLVSCFTRQADRESTVQDEELQLISGWKLHRCEKTPPAFRLVRVPPPELQDAISNYFAEFRAAFAPCPVVEYLKLSFLTGDRFVAALDDFLRPQLRRGVVSLFSALRRLYTRNRVALIGLVLQSYVQHLEGTPSTFGPPLGARVEKRQDETEGPQQQQGELATCLLYAYMLLAQHLDFTGQTAEALQVIQKAIDHTPTFADLYLVKGRIYKHAGAYQQACELHEKARNLDLADRFLNSKACSYLLRVNRTEEAKAVARLFTRQSESEDLPDTQCMWFELKMGRALERGKDYAEALAEFHATIRHFEEIHEDQFDFHPYCLRKSTFRAYVAFLRMQDKVWSHSYFRQAAQRALRIYMAVHDGTIQLSKGEVAEAETKAPQGAKAKKKTAASKQQQPPKPEKKQPQKYPREEPLVAAQKILDRLLSCCATDEETSVAHYHFAFRKGATMGMVLALVRLMKLTKNQGLRSRLTPLLLHFCSKGDLSAIPEEMRELAVKALSLSFGREMALTVDSLQAARQALTKSLMEQCAARPGDFVLRRRALEALELAGEAVPEDSPLMQFPKLAAAAADPGDDPTQQPSLADCEALLAQLQQTCRSEGPCERFKVRAAASRRQTLNPIPELL